MLVVAGTSTLGGFAVGLDRLAASGAQVVLVVDEQRGAELLGEVLDRHAADREPTVVADLRGVRQQAPLDRAHRRPPTSPPPRFAYGFG